MRILFLIVADFVFTAHLEASGPLARLSGEQQRRAVLVEGEGGRARIVAVPRELRAEGVRPHMTVAASRARVGHIWTVGYDAQRVARASSKLAGVLVGASPQVHVMGDGVFWLGAGGCRYLGGEVGLIELAGELVHQAGYHDLRMGVADSVIAARAAAIHGLGIIPEGGDEAALAPLPLSVLPFQESSQKSLWALGIRSVGAFTALPRSQIAARFGPDAIKAHEWAEGADRRTVPVFDKSDPMSIEVDFEAPHTVAEPALFVLQGGMDRLLAPHRSRGFGVRCLKIALKLVEGSWEREIRPADPVTDPHRMVEMCRALLQDAELPSMMEGVRVSVAEVGPARVRQEGLWEGGRKKTVTLEYTLMRLQGRLGAGAVRVAGERRDAHLPEEMGHWRSVGLSPGRRRAPGSCCVSAAWRLKAQPLRLQLHVEADRPMRAELDGQWERIERLVGPQRIETGWHEPQVVRGGAEHNGSRDLVVPIRRDYWYAELSGGVALSIFRDLNSGQWFLQGLLD